MNYKIFHNPKCQKSRNGLKYLKDNQIKPEIIDYIKERPFTKSSLTEIINQLNIKPIDLVRKQDVEYKQKFKDQHLSDMDWIAIMVENPKLIRRPIITNDKMAVLGDVIQNIDLIL